MSDELEPSESWRRKAGSTMLAMILALAAMWVRSQFATDSFAFDVGHQHYRLSSTSSYGISLACWHSERPPIMLDVAYWFLIIILTPISSWLLLCDPPRSSIPTSEDE
jgi:hypothetical protein